jgi:hypothetical protein
MDFFVIKYNSNLERQYINQLGVPGKFTYAHSVAVDANFNVYVAGYTTGRFDGTPILGSADLFLAKYDSNGEFKYTTQLGGLALTSTKGYSAATDAFGHVYVAGDTTGELDNNTLSGSTDSFVCQYNTIDGVLQYCNQQGVAGAGTFGRSVAVDSSGNFYMAGDTTGWLDGNPNRGNSDYFVTKYNKDGNWQFTNQFGVAGATTFGNAVAVDATGSVYLAGETSGTLYFDALTGIGSTDFFVAKFNGSGARQYLHQLGAVGQPTSGQSVTVDASNNAYVAGYTFGGLDGNVADLGLSYFFVTKYDKDGVRK